METRNFDWLIVKLQPLLKKIRSKDMAIFRALCALPTSFVRAGSKYHDLLLANGYSCLEISYANMLTVQYQTADGVLRVNSIIVEKIAVELFRAVLDSGGSFPDLVYQQLSSLFEKYTVFDIKCYGTDKLLEAMGDCPPIQNIQTFVWFSNYAPSDNAAFSAFDVLDPHWDAVADYMKPERYRTFFDTHLSSEMDADEIRRRIARYEAVSGEDYLLSYYGDREHRNFCLLVEKGIIDLWDAFTASLDADGNAVKDKMLGRIGSYLCGLATVQAFRFVNRFLNEYGFDAWEHYLKNLDSFINSLVDRRRHSYGCEDNMWLKPMPSYMDGAMRLTLLYWLEEYCFQKKPASYLAFMVTILSEEDTVPLFPEEKLKPLFKLLITESDLMQEVSHKLRDRYMTAEEKEEKEAEEAAAKQRRSEAQQREFVDETIAEYKEKLNGTVVSIQDALGRATYRSNVAKVLYPLALKDIQQILADKDYCLDSASISALLKIFAAMVKTSQLYFPEAQKLISNIKEEPVYEHEDYDTPAC